MDGYSAIGTGEYGDRPLFGQTTIRDKLLGWVCAGVTGICILLTLLCAFIQPQIEDGNSKGVNIYFAVCLLLLGISHLVLIQWYKQGDLDPKFVRLQQANTVILTLLTICGLLYIFEA